MALYGCLRRSTVCIWRHWEPPCGQILSVHVWVYVCCTVLRFRTPWKMRCSSQEAYFSSSINKHLHSLLSTHCIDIFMSQIWDLGKKKVIPHLTNLTFCEWVRICSIICWFIYIFNLFILFDRDRVLIDQSTKHCKWVKSNLKCNILYTVIKNRVSMDNTCGLVPRPVQCILFKLTVQ